MCTKVNAMLSMLLVLFACVPEADKAADSGTPVSDADGDGYLTPEDCDDTNPDAHPGAAEVCDPDEVDEDCDGLTDDADADAIGAQTVYADIDGDGYGNPEASAQSCEVSAGYTVNASDCDDGNPDIHAESSWFVDADGDGVGGEEAIVACPEPGLAVEGGDCDDADATIAAARTWSPDGDGDGYGSTAGSVEACDAPGAQYVLPGGDCDDRDPTVSPGATEVCDEADNDCDGATDDADDGLDGSTGSTWYADDDGDGYGGALYTLQACDQPSGYRAELEDCDDADAATRPGGTEVCDDGSDNDCDGTSNDCALESLTLGTGTADALFQGTASSGLGFSVAFIGDFFGDGSTSDVAIAAPGVSTGASTGGGVYLFNGPSAGTTSVRSADVHLYSSNESALAGIHMSAGGDLDGDGNLDLLVASRGTGDYNGATHVVYGPVTGTADLATVATTLSGNEADDDCYYTAGAGDLDGDGRDDFVAGCPGADGVSGEVWVFTSAPTADTDFASVGYRFGGGALDGAGTAPSIGDTNGDGIDDLAVSTNYSDKVYLVLGPIVADGDLGGADVVLTATDGALGYSMDVGDVDADGYADLLVGHPDSASGLSTIGRAYLYPGDTSGLATGAGDYFTFSGDPRNSASPDFVGGAVAIAGDTDGDGHTDLLVGAYAAGAGKAYLVFGPPTGDLDLEDQAVFTGGTSGDGAGCSVDGGDDDGDGKADVLIGASTESSAGAYAGSVYLLSGIGI